MSSLEPKRTGKRYWRSLDELADSPQFRKFVEQEFPAWADEMLAPASRRSFLKFMGASVALAGMTACRFPTEEILPFAHRPEGYVPGEGQSYATAMELGGASLGLVVTSFDGRPIKIEGNQLHPESLGATGARAQASVLELYDPDRSRTAMHDGAASSWDDFDRFAFEHFGGLRGSGGRGLRVLAAASSSPTLAEMRRRFKQTFPQARWHEYEPLSRDNARDGAALAFGRPVRTVLSLAEAETVVAFDEDFLLDHPSAVRLAREFMTGRNPDGGRYSRLWVVESGQSVTGGVADHRLPLAQSKIPVAVGCLAARLFLDLHVALPAGAESMRGVLEGFHGHPLFAELDLSMADELVAHPGHSAILAGPRMPAEVHALVHLMNQALGNVGHAVRYVADPDEEREHHVASLEALTADLGAGKVDTLLILGGNPVFDAPGNLGFADALSKAKQAIHLSLYNDETSRVCGWHLPAAHFLESWGDSRAWDGTLAIVQPLIAPLYGGRSAIELLATLTGEESPKGYDLVRRTAAATLTGGDFEKSWRTTLHDGRAENSAWPQTVSVLTTTNWAGGLAELGRTAEPTGVEVVFSGSAGIYDGRFANNGWLQELPDPMTKLTWDNAAVVGPSTAESLGVGDQDLVRVTIGDRSADLPVYVLPGQAHGAVGVSLGYGRRAAGDVGNEVGVDLYPLRNSASMHVAEARVEKLPGTYTLASTQDHYAIDRIGFEETAHRVEEFVREVDLTAYRHDPEHAMHREGPHYEPVDLWEPHKYDGYKWGMTIDLNTCTGCNACVVACQAENNIPVVGKDEVTRGREMHWIRIDRYFSGEPDAPGVSHQPLTCHHCENAPCEQVCPVAATTHDHEGLNVMVYNRCVGTRYCANNCPYKVRRFNYFNNHKNESAVETMVYNPEVTVRSRGVMEKCTFCVQRITTHRIGAKNENRRLQDGEFTTACAQACPTRAITFGDLNDPESLVARKAGEPRSYAMLEEINVKPRTRYLARIRNRKDGGGEGGGDSGHSGAA